MQQRLVRNSGPSLLRIPLIDPLKQQPAKLSIRKNTWEEELGTLPKGVAQVHQLVLASRNGLHGQAYNLVLAWNRLRQEKEYWLAFGLGSEGEYLAHFSLPEGPMLGRLTVLAQLFDRTTIMLVGQGPLHFLVECVRGFQADSEERRNDYQAIFSEYCSVQTSFDRDAFCELIRLYLGRKYGIAPARESSSSLSELSRQSSKKPARIALLGEQYSQLLSYAKALEQVIESRLGKRYLPKRPAYLRNL